ncbi:class I SAM-dependent methyltransferase [Maritalea mediterranea]|uniref:Class I SAM-dependent methyltransferase n=1 Tax=Maritalea mediterranea TaxID=2909667 RepID=A0ABS9EA69_9HYPH|nr:class I SAM-dependent methyltransferase [Maritalea mediterranea]MCF4099658.1 class I SAM-dependent methyltransferase [Maritalea mediterranea]
MSEQNIQFWDKRAASYDRAMSDHDQIYRDRMARLRAALSPQDQVMDFGCASGEIALDLAPHVKTIEGIDVSSKMIELAQTKASERQFNNVSFLATDLFDPRLEPESYDAIIALNVLHLVRDHIAVLPRLKELLKPGGKLLVETPCLGEACWWQKGLIRAAGAIGLAPYVHIYQAQDPQKELAQCGFTILGSTYAPTHDHRATVTAQKNEQEIK